TKGRGPEIYQPHFTFQGFRYVAVSGWPGEVKPEDFTGVVVHSAMARTGNFESSSSLLNQLQHNIIWGQKGNFVDVPTDCPQRDERLGWTGDAQVFAGTASFNHDTAGFYTKWLKDVALDQEDYPGATTDKDLIQTAYFARSTTLLAKTAKALGKTEDAAEYESLEEKIKSAFQKEFVTPSGRLSSNTQTAYALALAFELLPE